MPGQLMHVGATIQCPHAVPAQVTPTQARVMVNGMAVALMTDQIMATGCPFTVPPGKPQPCALAKWMMPTTRVLINGSPAMLLPSPALVPVFSRAPTRFPPAHQSLLSCRCALWRHEATMNTQVDYPFHFDNRFRTASTSESDHARDMIEQLLMTDPGERVNRPDFGSGLRQLTFAPNSPELAAALQFTVRAALQQWLGDLVEVQDLNVSAVDATLTVDLKYTVRSTHEERTEQFVRPL